MIAYKGNKAPVVTQGGFVICEFDGETAEVTQSVGKVLKGLGYRVEESGNGTNRASEDANTADNRRGRGVSARNSESGD